MKRAADEDDDIKQEEPGKKARTVASDDEDDDLDAPVSGATKRAGGVKKGSECPYLDTVSRQVLTRSLNLLKT